MMSSVQAPAAQAATPFCTKQAAPHCPQLLSSEETLVSQPVAASTSQSPKPELQLTRPQLPEVQRAFAFGRVQEVPFGTAGWVQAPFVQRSFVHALLSVGH